jgi:uncharacterized protein
VNVDAAARRGAAVLLLTAATLVGSSARALDVPPLQGRVNDHAQLLTPEQRSALEAKLTAYETRTTQQFTLLTVPTLDGDPIENFGIAVAEKWKLGSEKEDNGLILIVAAKDRKTRIEIGHGLEGALPDVIEARVLREVVQPAFRANDYAGGINGAFDVLMKYASGEAQPPAAADEPPAREKRRGTVWGLLSPLLLPLILFFLFSGLGGGRRRRRGGFFIPPFIGGGGFGGGGGGWGGGGGGGFSGGGGSFGGGGASGDW